MKTYRPVSIVVSLIVALVLGLVSLSDARPRGGEAGLYIKRSPAIGNDAYVTVWLDGHRIGGILWGQSFDYGIPAGRHVIEVRLDPAVRDYLPSGITLDAQAGRTYRFMAMKKGGALVLGRL